jgi:TonB-linked SusC/RagA family outer membrane protein
MFKQIVVFSLSGSVLTIHLKLFKSMKKKRPKQAILPKDCRKLLRIMKLIIVCVLLGTNVLWAGSSYAQITSLDLNLSNVELEEVFDAIRRQSEFDFFYNNDQINTSVKVSVHMKNVGITKILDVVLPEMYEYQIHDRYVLISKRKEITPAPQPQQTKKEIRGRVTDMSGEPIIGANIVEKGTVNGVITDVDGNFTLLVSGNATIYISYIGYIRQEVAINNRTNFSIILVEDSRNIEEVVVIGYGTMKKSDLTGAITSVTSDDIKNYAVTNFETAIVGKLAGVYASTNSGQPGSGAAIRIRGIGTVNDNKPLYVVDGMFLDAIDDLNPNDIDRIEVLKDASSTAIYGSRGANGVILITTKKGNVGDFTVTLDSYIGTSSSIYTPEMSNSEQLYNFLKESYSNDNLTFPSGIKELYERGVDTNWWDVSTKPGLTQNYNLSIRGGSEKIKSALSIGYVSEDGFIRNTSYYRYTLHSYLEYKLSDRISLGANLNISDNKSRQLRGFYEPIWQITSADPFSYVYNPNVEKSDSEYEYNKYAATEYSYTNNPLFLLETNNSYTKRANTYGNIFANIEILKDLNYNVQFSFNKPVSYSNNFDPKYSLTPTELNIAQLKYRSYNRVTTSQSNALNTIWQQTLTFDKKIRKSHNLNAVLGMTYENNLYQDIAGTKNTTPGNGEEYWVLDAATSMLNITGIRRENAILSYLGRVNYTYANKYLATVSFRADGSSRFSKNNRWGYFPSFSLGWRLNEESFFQNLNLPQISNLKIRFGWGQTGNQNIANNAAITTVGTTNGTIYVFGDSPNQAYGLVNMGNNNIRWEVSEQTNWGIDAGLFNNKLQLTLDYYNKKTKDMLLQLNVPSIAGYPNSPWTNAGSIQNTGFDFSATYKGQVDDFAYNVGLNFSTYKNKVISLGSGNEPIYYTGLKSAMTKTEVGKPVALFYGYKQEEIFQNQKEIDEYVNQSGELLQPLAKPGDFKFADVNGDGKLNEDDRTYIGNPHPDMILGINFSGTYKNFDLTFSFAGTLGNDMWNEYLFKGFATSTDNVLLDAYANAWRQEGDETKYPRISQSDLNNNARASSWYVENGSYIRLKNIQLGYNLPQYFVNKTKLFSSCRFYLSGQNLFTFTKYEGMDPEVGANDDVTSLGIESRRYPSSKIITAGVNVTF